MRIVNRQDEVIFEEPVDTVVKFLKAKNLLCRNAGATIDLVPESQIIEVKLKKKLNKTCFDNSICPYCLVYYNNENCGECPMHKADNECTEDAGNTYEIVIRELNDRLVRANIPQLDELIDEFNSLYFKDID